MKAVLIGLMLTLGWTSVAVQAADKSPTVVKADDDHAEHGHDDHGHAHLGHADADTSPSQVKGDLAIFSAIVFLLLVVILRKFAWGPIAQGLEKRERHVAHEIASAEKANFDAKKSLAEYQLKLDEAQAQVRGMLEEARRDAEGTKQEIVAAAKAEAAGEVARGKREIETAKDQAMREISQVATDQALALAGKLLQQQLKAADHARLIEDSLAKFPSKVNLN